MKKKSYLRHVNHKEYLMGYLWKIRCGYETQDMYTQKVNVSKKVYIEWQKKIKNIESVLNCVLFFKEKCEPMTLVVGEREV